MLPNLNIPSFDLIAFCELGCVKRRREQVCFMPNHSIKELTLRMIEVESHVV